MSDEIKHLDVAEFCERGYLHEVNRLVLHPLGLALSIERAKEAGRIIRVRESDIDSIVETLDTAFLSADEELAVRLRGVGELFLSARQIGEGEEMLSAVWDQRDDPEGVYYGDDLLSPAKAKAVLAEMMDRRRARIEALGYVVQPIEGEQVLTTNYTDPGAI